MAEPRIRIREARASDDASIADVHAAAIRERGPDAYDDEQVRAWLANVHPERYPTDSGAGLRVIVAERESDPGDVVGFGWLDCAPSDRDDGTGELVAVYVHPDCTRQGIGRALLERLEGVAREWGLEEVVLVASRNAVGFYRRQGYEPNATVELELGADVALEARRMRKRL
ncbi:GNAT family N-acetyltransferase [Halopiger goleimassiliensis]|uniref:GNAT family N-acetyltransferase n=1 Tax=Halopiger goleimassiliensis TaxID=1293048 RepID=UPI000677777C|nr:GNAT family N-acetyltransferase [Halopiger goleimassiliensis]